MSTTLQANQSFGAKLLHILTLGTRDVYKTDNGQLITMKADQGRVEVDDDGEVNIFDAKNVKAKGVDGVEDEFYLHNCTGENNKGKKLNDAGDIFELVDDDTETSGTSATSSDDSDVDDTDESTDEASDTSSSNSELNDLLNQLLQLLQSLMSSDSSETDSDAAEDTASNMGIFDTTVNDNEGTVNIENNYNPSSESSDDTSDASETSDTDSTSNASDSNKTGVTINTDASDGDDIVNNAYEKEYDGSEDRKLEKKSVATNEGTSVASGKGNIFNTTVNGNKGTVNIENNYYGKGTNTSTAATKEATSSDFISKQSTKDGTTTYELSNGMKVEVPEGTEIGDDSFYIDPDTGETSFSGLSGAKITGTKKDDAITLYDCKETEILAGKGDDNIQAYNSEDITLNGEKGNDTIKTVSCDGITNKGGNGDDTITNVNCSGTVNNDGGKGKDKITNEVYDILNKTADDTDTSSTSATSATSATSSNNETIFQKFLTKLIEFLEKFQEQ